MSAPPKRLEASSHLPPEREPGNMLQFLPSLISAECCDGWRRTIQPAIEKGRRLDDHPDFSRSSSSLRLRALRSDADGIDLEAIIEQIWRDPLRSMVQSMLGPRVALLSDQCWGRCQFAPGRYPEGHAAHQWHQDGALHFDFVQPYSTHALLQMLTCWISLTPSGEDAPGLELVRLALPDLLSPAELDGERLAARFERRVFWRPVCRPGDALVFNGGTVHRTHVAPAMQQDRSSLELRFVAAAETNPRLRDERIVAIP